jgi:hypothetical protein
MKMRISSHIFEKTIADFYGFGGLNGRVKERRLKHPNTALIDIFRHMFGFHS